MSPCSTARTHLAGAGSRRDLPRERRQSLGSPQRPAGEAHTAWRQHSGVRLLFVTLSFNTGITHTFWTRLFTYDCHLIFSLISYSSLCLCSTFWTLWTNHCYFLPLSRFFWTAGLVWSHFPGSFGVELAPQGRSQTRTTRMMRTKTRSSGRTSEAISRCFTPTRGRTHAALTSASPL